MIKELNQKLLDDYDEKFKLIDKAIKTQVLFLNEYEEERYPIIKKQFYAYGYISFRQGRIVRNIANRIG